jgi:large subunit ribosomal protein L22
MANGYTFAAYDKELMARAVGRHLAISSKQSIEICSRIRNKHIKKAKLMLTDAIKMKRAIPYTRFNGDVGHKPGMAAGRFPVKSATQILALIKSAEANAQVKGLNTANLYIVHVNAQRAARPMHQGRQRGTATKRTHVELVLQERAEVQKEKKVRTKTPSKSKEVKKETPNISNKVRNELRSSASKLAKVKPQVPKVEGKKEEVKEPEQSKENKE